MPQCPDITQLQALVDQQCPVAESELIARHVATCPDCAEAVAELRTACLPLQALTEAPPADMPQRLLEAVRGLTPLAPLTCDEALEWVSARLDGALDHSQLQRLEAHLLACGMCYRAANELELTTRAIRATDEITAPAGLLERVQAAAELAAPVRRPAGARLWRRVGMSLAGVAAAAAVIFAVLFTNVPAPGPVSLPTVAVAPVPSRPAPAPNAAPRTENRVAVTPTVARPVTAAPGTPTASHVVAPMRVAVAPTAPAHLVAPAPRPIVTPTTPSFTPAPTIVGARPVSTATAAAIPAVPQFRPERSVPETQPEPRTEVAVAPRAMPAPLTRVVPEQPKPAPVEVAVAPPPAPAPAPAPAVTVAAAPPAAASHRSRSNWVSRPASTEREVYRSEDVGTRLADAQTSLTRDAKTVRMFRAPGFSFR